MNGNILLPSIYVLHTLKYIAEQKGFETFITISQPIIEDPTLNRIY